MIVAIDGTPLTLSSGGLRRYTVELVRTLRDCFPEDEYHIVSDQLGPPRNFLERRWWSIGLPLALARLQCDVFHGTDFAVPYLPLRPAVMSVHDISPWLEPAWHYNAGRVRRRTPYLVRLGLTTMIITPTRAVQQQVIDLFRIHPDRVAVVPYAAAPAFAPAEPYARRPYILFVGTVEPRKNVPALVDAWHRVRARYDVDLLIAGRRRPDGPSITPEPGLTILGEVTDSDLARLYSGAVALIYPSHYEGFGLPVLEAMRCGTAVITSEDPALVEVSEMAAIHTGEFAAAIERLLADPQELDRRRQLSLCRSREFSWERTAQLTREVYAEAIRRFGF